MTHKSGNMAQSMKDKRGEAMEYDKNAIGVYRTPSESEQKMLVGHVPIELSSLMNNFLKANDSNKLVAKVSGKRKREVGLSSEIQSSEEGVQIGENTGPAASGSQRKIHTHTLRSYARRKIIQKISIYILKIAFKVLAYLFVLCFC